MVTMMDLQAGLLLSRQGTEDSVQLAMAHLEARVNRELGVIRETLQREKMEKRDTLWYINITMENHHF